MTVSVQKSRIVDSAGDPFIVTASSEGRRYESLPNWLASSSSQRSWESADTDRLNEAHWLRDTDQPINAWLSEKLSPIRSRSTYETRQNGTLSGIVQTLADDVVGPDGPILEVQSDDEAYNEAGERVWRDWFSAPTTRPNVSGAATLKLWVRNLPRCGEFLARIVTSSRAPGAVKMRLRLTHPRWLGTPAELAGDPWTTLGVQIDPDTDAPRRYWIGKTTPDGYQTVYEPWPPDLVIHEFIADEEGQARGFPWFAPTLQASADLRDFDDQIQDAARQMADQAGLLYTESPDEVWLSPEETTVQRRTIKMCPPGWKPYQYQASAPPVQYPDYRAERQREIGRPLCMPLMIVRLDSSRHNYSSARFDGQSYARFISGIQTWLSGSEQSYGTLNRLADDVLAEARFSEPALRRRPRNVSYKWTWASRPHVDPAKERNADKIGLETRTLSLTDSMSNQGRSVESHVKTLARERKLFLKEGLTPPAYMNAGGDGTPALDPNADDAEQDAKAASNQ